MSAASPLRPAILLLGALLAAGCGFRLRGEATLPAGFERLWLETPPESRIGEPLARALERAGARRVGRREDAAVLLVVHADELRTEVLSIGGGARIREFRIRRRVELEARSGDGTPLLPRQAIELSRDYNFDERSALGAELEAEQLREELEREMLAAILRRLERAARR